MKTIPLTRGYETIVDDDDYEVLNISKWQVRENIRSDTKYAMRNYWDKNTKSTKSIFMHEVIMMKPKGMQIDHVNRNGLDNRRINLRICTQSQNRANIPPYKSNKSGYKGVTKGEYGNWRSIIRENGKPYHIGYFNTPELAAKAYDKEAHRIHGEFAYLNFPELLNVVIEILESE